jgi:hypothetical protein
VQIKVITGAENTDRNLAAVGDKNFGKIFRHKKSPFTGMFSIIPIILYRYRTAFATKEL